jgi:phage gp36-like protein
MFLTATDYTAVVDAATFEIMRQGSEANLARAEGFALEEISSYLRSRYDVAAAFAATGDDRNRQLVMVACDIALYHIASWLPKRIGFEIRRERYERAIAWLESVQAGKASPDLPPLVDSNGNDTGTPIRWGSLQKNDFTY